MGLPQVRLLLRDQEVQVCAFPEGGGALRLGRMKENDVVINNLSVSRFHGTLRWEDGVFTVEDLGSENGIYLNGRRVVGSAMVEPGDEIAIGKHHMVVEWEGSTPAPPAPDAGPSDPWDAATTYLAGDDTRAKFMKLHAEGAGAEISEAEYADEPAGEDGDEDVGEISDIELVELDPEPTDEHQVEGLFSSLDAGAGAGGGADDFEAVEIPLEPEIDAAVAELDLEGHGPLFPEPDAELAAVPVPERDPEPESARESDDVGGLEPELQPEPETLLIEQADEQAGPDAEAPLPPQGDGLYAGLILQRGGVLQRILSWDAERLTVGRGGDCDVVLATPEVSRRHAMFVRSGDTFEVRDLESINGTLVNGNRVGRCTLESGDCVTIEDFELTFVVEHHPIGDEIVTQSVREAAEETTQQSDGNLTQLDETMGLAPYPAQDEADAGEVTAAPPGPEPEPVLEQAEVAADLEVAADQPDDEKELEAAPDDGRPAFELEVDVAALPEPLQEALRSAGELKVPVVLRVRD